MVCHACKEPVRDRYDQFIERLEYVRSDHRERAAVIEQRRLCRKCMELAVNDARPTQNADQGTLL